MSSVAFLKGSPFFANLNDSELEPLAASLQRREFAKNVIIFDRGSPGHTMYIIESGKVRLFLLSEMGQEMSVDFLAAGDVFGELSLLDGLPRVRGAMTTEKTVVYYLRRDDFLRNLEANPHLAAGIIGNLSARLRDALDSVESLAFLDVHGRVAKKLLELAEKHGVEDDGAVSIDLRLTQQDLASLIGASRESVNKVMGSYREKGWIRMEGQKVAIVDSDSLERRIY
ncbi:MAG: Crp/Fnr family transcriptional regulator [Anaerolineae bacterium]